jgi:hypothetical protein
MTAAYPPYQHWTTAGFRITVAFYKRQSPGRCLICGVFPARHHVWADGCGDRAGWSSSPASFCDDHRPAKGILPAQDYLRLVRGGMAGPLIYERTDPWPGQSCTECGQPPVYRAEHRCGGCDDPAWEYTTQKIEIRVEGVTEHAPVGHHKLHSVGQEFRCAAHPLAA